MIFSGLKNFFTFPQKIFFVDKEGDRENYFYECPQCLSEKFKANSDRLFLFVLPGHTVAQCIYLSGIIEPLPMCSGLGCCALCRVRFVNRAPSFLPEEKNILGMEALNKGWRLGCKHIAHAGMELELPDSAKKITPLNYSFYQKEGGKKSTSVWNFLRPETENNKKRVLLAVDLGTTSLQWSARILGQNCLTEKYKNLEEEDSYLLAVGQEINPQMGAGSEIMSRLKESLNTEGRKLLARLSQNSLRRIIEDLPYTTERICLAANPAVTSLFLGIEALGLVASPYTLPLAGNAEYHLPGLPPVYIPPQFSPFIGGDISSGLTAILNGLYGKPKYPFLLADLGTNGEFVLAVSEDSYFASSLPLGPALEGIGLSCGAAIGSTDDKKKVVSSFYLTPQGLESEDSDLSCATGISGSGYLSLLNILLEAGVLNGQGHFTLLPSGERTSVPPFILKLRDRIEQHNKHTVFRISSNLFLSGTDVEELLKVKAAFSLLLKELLKAAGLLFSDLKNIFLAGALGKYIPLSDLEGLGFFPAGLSDRVVIVGNASLRGAELLLACPGAISPVLEIKDRFHLVDITSDENFFESYMSEMFFR